MYVIMGVIDDKEYERLLGQLGKLQGSKIKEKAYFDGVLSVMRLLSDLEVDNDTWDDLYKRRSGLSGVELKYYQKLKFAVMRVLANVEYNMSYKDPKTLCGAYIPHKYGRVWESAREKKANKEIELVDADGLVSPIIKTKDA